VIILAAGTAMTVGLASCKSKSTPAPDPQLETEPTTNPPAPVIPEVTEPEPSSDEVTPDRDPEKPTWEDVKSGHPAGATNPPIPELIVTPDGHCFKKWTSPMVFRPGKNGNQVLECGPEADCGTPIQCPDKAAAILADHAKDDTPK
jgi:hypothetical protein